MRTYRSANNGEVLVNDISEAIATQIGRQTLRILQLQAENAQLQQKVELQRVEIEALKQPTEQE